MVSGTIHCGRGQQKGKVMETNEKQCPYCAEVIKAQAVICRYCQRDLPETSSAISIAEGNVPGESPTTEDDVLPSWTNISPEQRHSIENLGIAYDGERYSYQEYHYEKLTDAVNYAQRHLVPGTEKYALQRIVFGKAKRVTVANSPVQRNVSQPAIKLCPHCKEKIQGAATKCPHCKEAIFSTDPGTNAVVKVVVFVVLFFVLYQGFSAFVRHEAAKNLEDITEKVRQIQSQK